MSFYLSLFSRFNSVKTPQFITRIYFKPGIHKTSKRLYAPPSKIYLPIYDARRA